MTAFELPAGHVIQEVVVADEELLRDGIYGWLTSAFGHLAAHGQEPTYGVVRDMLEDSLMVHLEDLGYDAHGHCNLDCRLVAAVESVLVEDVTWNIWTEVEGPMMELYPDPVLAAGCPRCLHDYEDGEEPGRDCKACQEAIARGEDEYDGTAGLSGLGLGIALGPRYSKKGVSK